MVKPRHGSDHRPRFADGLSGHLGGASSQRGNKLAGRKGVPRVGGAL